MKKNLWVRETHGRGKAVAALCKEQVALQGRAEQGAAVQAGDQVPHAVTGGH